MGRVGQQPTPLLAAWTVVLGTFVLTGCTVHHYHHYDPLPERTAPLAPSVPATENPASAKPAGVATASAPPASPNPASQPPTNSAQTPTPQQPRDEIAWHPAGMGIAPIGGKEPPALPEPRNQPEPTVPQPAPRGGSPTPEQPGGVAEGTRLSIDQVINAVLVSDPRLRAGFELINQANANALTASLPPNPTMYTDIELLPLTRPFTATDQGGPPQYDLQFTQPIDWWLFGKRAANMVRENRGVQVAESDYADRIRTRIVDAASGYYDVVEAEGLLSLARQDVANLKRVEEATLKGLKAGGRAEVELKRVQLDRLIAERSVRDAEANLVAAKARLRAMIGRTDSDPAFALSGGLENPLSVESIPLEEAYSLAVQNRPDIESDRRKVAQAQADVEAQRRSAYPTVSPMFGYTRQFQKKAIGFPDADSWTAAMTMSLPLWDRNQGNRAKAASVLAQARFGLAGDLADLRAEVTTAIQQLETARANAIAVSDTQLKLAREVLQSIITAYAAGARPLIDVLDAERNFRDTNRAYLSARAAYWRAVYRFQSAIGQQVPR